MYWLYRFLHGFEPIEEEVGGAVSSLWLASPFTWVLMFSQLDVFGEMDEDNDLRARGTSRLACLA